MEVSLIITTYNWPQALKLTLQSVLAQSRLPDELIVADDGSSPETARVVKDGLSGSGIKWRHVWHEDRGVRQSRIKNLAVKYSSGAYLIFVDQDVVLHPEFVADHLRFAEEGAFLQGKRLLLPKKYTAKVLEENCTARPTLWVRGLGNRKNALRIPTLGKIFAKSKGFEASLRGCNLSIFRSDFLAVDGLDETFDGSWGREDSDICYRLFHAGVRVKNLWCVALQYHLNHQLSENWDRERLDSELTRNLGEKRVRALRGFSNLSSEGGVVASSG